MSLLFIITSFLACSSGPESEGKALASEFCSAMKSAASDPAKAMSLGAEWGQKSTAAAQKYASEPAKMQEFLKGYQSGSAGCMK